MKLIQKLVEQAHLLILLWAAYVVYDQYEQHEQAKLAITADIATNESQTIKIKKDLKDLEKYYNDIEDAKRRIELVAQQVEKVQQQLPQKISDVEDLELITNLARELNIKDIFLTPKEEENKGFYYVKAYEFKATGTFLQFLVFLEKLGATKRLLNIGTFELNYADKKQKGRFQLLTTAIRIEAYRYNPLYKENRGIKEIEQKFKNKGSAPSPGQQGQSPAADGGES